MSWGFSLPATEANRIHAVIDSASIPHNIAGEVVQETLEQFAAAKKAVLALIDSGAIGTSGKYLVSFSGHTNPGHKAPASGAGGNEFVTVTVGHAFEPANQ